eukprot:COSAG03_NODE_200_length_10751_cov_2.905745_3_plen_57_part_00
MRISDTDTAPETPSSFVLPASGLSNAPSHSIDSTACEANSVAVSGYRHVGDVLVTE